MAPATCLVHDPCFLEHDPGPTHPECPERLQAIAHELERSGLAKAVLSIPIAPVELRWLAEVHDSAYPALVASTCKSGIPILPTGDTNVCPASYEIALAAAGGVLGACDAIMAQQARNGFCAIRPPGHHARISGGMGFCVFNNIAVAARYLQRQHGLARIAILDWDVHHGNGTQEIFYADPSVLFASSHLWPFYPGTGLADETGTGAGLGTTLNFPLDAGDGDDMILEAFDTFCEATIAFKPDFVLVSAGYDAHAQDKLGMLSVSDEGFRKLTRMVKDVADSVCAGRLLLVLEGGYTPEVLAGNVRDSIAVMMG
ncbi:MAG: histone deacetylase [Deltaproteobacteria bacterium]|nr:histone deacetylase [Deltaproteobacteria bacterium]